MEFYENLCITIKEVSKQYNANKGIEDVSTTFKAGVLNIIVGENGSGKSTLFKCIMGLVSYKGQIIKRRHRIGYAPEEYVMPLHMTIVDFLDSIGRIKGMKGDELDENVTWYLDFFHLTPYRNKTIQSLSNGMRQKVNLMQAFIHEPKVIILDEPLAALDKAIIPDVVKLIKAKAKNQLVIVSTHNPGAFQARNKHVYRFQSGKLIND